MYRAQLGKNHSAAPQRSDETQVIEVVLSSCNQHPRRPNAYRNILVPLWVLLFGGDNVFQDP